MPNTVTPARRRREDDTDDESSQDESESSYSNASKRQRRSASESDGDGSEDDAEDQLLPNSYRRSPKGKQRAMVDHLGRSNNPAASQRHQPGSIVRVTLHNFVTYTSAEFHPGPNLNMIIGPNGTGKSTLVCAICLGLGWATSHLGRAKDIGEFVKHGSKRAEIQIELAADPERHRENPVITTKITKEGNKSEYYINDKKANRKGVQTLARSFSIQVDNLCQFLPQDRVVEFAALSPVDLLTHTQRAAAPDYMSDWHDELKTLRKDQKQWQEQLANVSDNLKNMENRQRLQEADVIRLRERAQMQERMSALAKMRPFPEYSESKKGYTEAKKEHKAAEKDLNRLQRNLEPNLRAAEEKKEYRDAIEKVVKQRQNLVQRSEGTVSDAHKKVNATQEKIQECMNEIESEKDAVKEIKQSIPRHQQAVQRVKKAMENPPPDYDMAEMNEKRRETLRQIREVEMQLSETAEALSTLGTQLRQRQETIKVQEREKENLQSQAGQQVNKLKRASQQSARAWDWIQNNRDRFSGEVFGPPMIECQVKNQRFANAVESMIPRSEMLAFTVTNRDDFRLLQDHVYTKMGLTDIYIRTCTQSLGSFTPNIPTGDLQRLGLETYILDLLQGPDAVLAMLCDNRNIHQAAFTSRDISEAQFEAIKRTSIGSWVTPSQTYTITRRREYGDQATSTRVNAIKKAQFFTDVPVDRQIEQEIDAKIREATGEIEQIKEEATELSQKRTRLEGQKRTLQDEKKELDDDKNSKQRALTEFQGLPIKRDQHQRKLDDAIAHVASFKDRRRAIEERQDKLCLEKGQQALDFANAVEALRGLHVQLFEAEILFIEATSDLEQLQALHQEEQRLLEERRREVNVLHQKKEELHNKAVTLLAKCQDIAAAFSPNEGDIYQEILNWTSDQLETEIQSTQARLEMTLGGGNENTLREFESRARGIEDKRNKLNEIEAKLAELDINITNVRGQWEPELDALIGKISDAFAENFARIQCAGEVAVYKHEDFENWSIQIKVKFRETEALSVLDSHRQSGGERAVSTIFYLMALQSLARAPFRVVDEINQGMDPRNERMVHSRMVDIACAEHTSQYFLITPKLLQGLKYHPNMKVHCIASGEHMPQNHRELDFEQLAQKALSLRGAGGATAAA